MNRVLAQFDQLEFETCKRVNGLSRIRGVRPFFTLISKLGDGWLWYALIAAFLIKNGVSAAAPALKLTVAALAGLGLYKLLKTRLVRERPFISFRSIECGTPPLDRYSFPSGHTLHAVNFTILFAAFVPGSIFFLFPFTILVALSRVILGLHYPTDVAAGAALGALLSLGVLAI
ncbi:MAG: phosphatase PAP2 family protein [Pseudomonadota bacterium]